MITRLSLSRSLCMCTRFGCVEKIFFGNAFRWNEASMVLCYSLSLSLALSLHALCHSNQAARLCAKHSTLANGHTGIKLQPGHNLIDVTTYAIFITEFHSKSSLEFFVAMLCCFSARSVGPGWNKRFKIALMNEYVGLTQFSTVRFCSVHYSPSSPSRMLISLRELLIRKAFNSNKTTSITT